MTRWLSLAVALLGATTLLSADGWSRADARDERTPLVIGHRGATGYLPEHTLASYELAIQQGADYIEPDLVSTKDGILIARHEVNITGTTDVSSRPQFANRKTTKTIDGIEETGWFADDFTLAEIKTLRAVQRVASRPQQFNGLYRVPTFSEVVALAKDASRKLGRQIGVYPETKHPTYHQQRRLALEPKLVGVLRAYGWDHRRAPVFIQSFEVANLKQLNKMTSVRLVQLIDAWDTNDDGSIDVDRTKFRPFDAPYDFTVAGDPRRYVDLVTPAGLAGIARYADGVGPWKRYIVGAVKDPAGDVNHDGSVNDADKTGVVSTLVEDAHEAGLFVHTWTFRSEARPYLLRDYGESPAQEYLHFYCLGVDGVFSDFPDAAVSSRSLFWDAPTACQPFVR